MNSKQAKKLRRYVKRFAKDEMMANIVVFQELSLYDRFRVAYTILFKRGDA